MAEESGLDKENDSAEYCNKDSVRHANERQGPEYFGYSTYEAGCETDRHEVFSDRHSLANSATSRKLFERRVPRQPLRATRPLSSTQ